MSFVGLDSMNRMLSVGLLFVLAGLIGGATWYWGGPADAPDTDGSDEKNIVELDKQKQKQIWDSEHVTFKIETHFGKPLIEVLKNRDRKRLVEFFQPDCRGTVLSAATGETRRASVVSETRIQSDGRPGKEVDRNSIVDGLLKSIGEMHEFERGRLRVLEIELKDDSQDVWRTRLLLTCRGRNRDGHLVAFRSEHDVLFRFVKVDGVAEKPVAAGWETVSQETRKAPGPLMEEVTEIVGLDRVELIDNWIHTTQNRNTYNFQMAVADFDGDDYLDIAIASGLTTPILLRSLKGREFKDVAESVGLKRWHSPSALVSWIDFNNDGFPDLLMGDRLYRNVSGKRFEDVTAASGLQIGFDPMGCVVADYDCDGFLDLYILYQTSTSSTTEKSPWVGDRLSGVQNRLWRNEGDGRFRDVTDSSSAHGGTRLTFAATWLFYDDDHLPDLYIANDFGHNVLLRNRGDGAFEDVTTAAACGDFATSMGVASGDINNDGTTEIYVANMYSKMGRRIIGNVGADDYPSGIYGQIQGSCRGNSMYSRANGKMQFRQIGDQLGVNEVGWAFAPAMADFDNDGWLDLYAATGYHSFERNKPDG
jgi:hypothetical protein